MKFNPLNLIAGAVLGAAAVIGIATGYNYVSAENVVAWPGVVQNAPAYPTNSNTLYDDGTILTTTGTRCLNWAVDLNKDCIVNPGDQAYLASYVGPTGTNFLLYNKPWTVTPSPTPTATNTNTPTPTATNTPTATPTPSLLANLIADTTGSNPACVEGSEGYDWAGLNPITSPEHNGPVYRGNATPPGNAAYFTVWTMNNWQANCSGGAELTGSASATISYSNFRAYFLKSDHTWVQFADPTDIYGWQDNSPTYGSTIYNSCSGYGNCNSPYTVPHNKGKQVYTAQIGLPSGVVGFWATYDASVSSGTASLMVNCGADYYTSAHGYISDTMVGKFVALTTTAKTVNCTNVSSTDLTSYPPPF